LSFVLRGKNWRLVVAVQAIAALLTLRPPVDAAEEKTKSAMLTVTPWDKYLASEGIPVLRGFAVQDLMQSKLGSWKRYGCDGAYVYLDGAGGLTTGFILEIQPGKQTLPVRHMYESRVVALSGQGEAHFWQDGGKRVTARWQRGTMFPFPLNVNYEIVNTGKEPARFYGVGWAPLAIDMYRDLDFVFNNKRNFNDRFNGQLDFFKPEPAELRVSLRDGLGYAVSVTNLIPDVNTIKLYPAGHGAMETAWREAGGSGTTNRHFSMAFDNLDSHVEQFQPAVYEIGHRHGPGANVMYLGGHGYSLIWPPEIGEHPFRDGKGDKVVRVDWGPNTVFVPPLNWYHQHFNPSPEPARFLKVGAFGSRVHMMASKEVFQEYPVVIEYQDEDPAIGRMFGAECAKRGIKSVMPTVERMMQLSREEKEKHKK
jgi:oxalate decarboxylase/phosphoglucose isomerase-like protein (cupin superfamily)